MMLGLLCYEDACFVTRLRDMGYINLLKFSTSNYSA